MAAELDDVDAAEENILYDLSVQTEWRLDNELFTRSPRDKDKVSIVGRLASASLRSVWTFLRTVGVPLQTATPCLLPEALVKLVNSQINWHIAVGGEGKVVAILQEQCVDIRSHRDGYESTVGRGSFPRDPCPQWRCVVWSPDNTMLACSRSCGAVDVFDIMGSQLFTIPGETMENTPHDLSCAVAALIFTDHQPTDNKWSAELLVINYHGRLKSYYVSRDKGYKSRHSFVFSGHYPLGISSVVYLSKHKMLLVGGCGQGGEPSSAATEAISEGITAWRLLSDMPHYKLVTDYDTGMTQANKGMSILSRLRLPQLSAWKGGFVDGVYKMCVSPAGDTLVVLHLSGKLSVWNLPSLRYKVAWALEDQPGYEEICPKLAENPQKRKRIKDLIPHKKLLDVNFWSNDALILARCTGAVMVCAVNTLHNFLGQSPEWFEPSPRVSESYQGGFLGIECEHRFPRKKLIADEGDEGDDSDDEDATWYSRSTRVTKQVLYYLTDSERFQPPRKKPKLVTRIYKLICLKSTTPEELYAHKIDGEEYGEALALARTYGLDCDLVYQRQWRKSPVSVASIQDYLSKISKRSWVLHECLERVPDNIDAMWELLQYGLRGTDLPALITIGKGEDGGRFILCDPEEGLYEDMSFDEFNPEDQRQKEEMKLQRMKELQDQVDFASMNLEQKELCRARLKLLQYIDRLRTYEHIMGGRSAAAEQFNSKFFKEFRSQNIVETAVNYAQMSNSEALEAMFTYHGASTLKHRLAILSNFPETTPPVEYKPLLPEMANSEDAQKWEEISWRGEPDWSEGEQCRAAIDPSPVDLGAFLYEDKPELEKYRSDEISKSLLCDWYTDRACEIERLSRLVDNALDLVKLAIQNRVEGLYDLLDDLLTMEMLVYECGVDDSLTFRDLQQMADYDKLELIMSKSSGEMYVKNLRRWMVPFLKQCERREAGAYTSLLHDYIITKAKTDLSLVVKIFETSKAGVSQPVIQKPKVLMSLALEAVYVCERDDQLKLAFDITQCLPQKDSQRDPPDMIKLHKEVDKLENHLQAMKIFNKHTIKKPIYYIRDTEGDPEEARSLMVKVTRLAGRRTPGLTEMQWRDLHDDVLSLQSNVYRCITADVCHEVYVESLLCSSSMDTIKLAGEMIERSLEDTKPTRQQRQKKVEYPRAVELVLSSAQEYFNSSAHLMDSCMDLARSCLNLILDTPAAVQQELDLIASLALLDDFGVSVLPLQVRLSTDRLGLVQEAVSKRPAAYKQSQKLLRLGHLLRIPGDTRAKRDGKVWKLIGEAAVKARDYEFGEDCCNQLISVGSAEAWTLCVDLAEQEDFSNIKAKVNLLSFAMTFCTADMIEPILQAKCLLETQLLIEKVSTDMSEETEVAVSVTGSPFSAKAAIKQTQHILSSTSRTTKAMLSTVTDGSWWKGAIHTLKQPTQRQTFTDYDDGNISFTRQGCHPFYESIIEDCYSNVSAINYQSGEIITSPEVEMSEKVLRAAKLEEMLTEGEKSQPASEVLLELAKSFLARDSSMGLAYLLALNKASDAEKCFEEFPSTDVSIQLALYYYALQIYTTLKPSTKPLPFALYRQDPTKVIRKVINHVTSRPNSDWPEEVVDLIPKLEKYREMLEDYNQAITLKKLGRGVDIVRFADDSEYKQETILGLAMSVDDDVYKIAVSLAERYELSVWEVYMSHLEFVFTDSGLTTEQVEERVTRLKILPELTEQPDKFCERMYKYVFPTIDGTDHERLMYFFQLLDKHDPGQIQGQTPDAHVKLLKKLKPVAPGLDYHKLMDGKTAPLGVLQPVLDSGNVNTLAKLAAKIPDGSGGFLHSSVVYSAWAVTHFWKPDQAGKQTDRPSGWIHRYESCGDFLQKLLPQDIVNFIDSIAFSSNSRRLLEISCRQEIVKRALRLCRQQGGGGGKKKKQEDSGKMSWDEAANQLQQRVAHLENVNSDTIRSFSQADKPKYQKYAEMYDKSCGNDKMIHQLLVTIVTDGEIPDLVDDVIQVAPRGAWTVRTAVQESVRLVAHKLRCPDSPCEVLGDQEVLTVLEKLVVNVQEHEEAGGDLVVSEDVMSLLRPFCSDSSVAVKPRLDVLHILEKSFHLSQEDTALLTFYRTEALMSAAWKEQKVSEADIQTDDSRQKLFCRLLDTSSNKEQFTSLCRLLKLWPPLPQGGDSVPPRDNTWVQVFTAMVRSLGPGGATLLNAIIADVCEGNPINLECTRAVFDVMVEHKEATEAVKFVLRSGHITLFPTAVETLAGQLEAVRDEDLLNIILQHRLVTSIVKTTHYTALIEYLLEKQGSDSRPDWLDPVAVANQLSEAGFQAEAGSVLLQARSSHPGLHTFGTALSVIGKWLKKS
ncbi:NBAS subunit of NRZ tethering complex-like isoform X1 [Haliotis rufescens]|uniref:NBAS subunit of NRZ tethering complex-like isoform X1 n=2 Tax=Haliotis rufescens TaxID=6454 RepID=UPI00201F033F|nr:NBAS subunit of NRZ tethering complex-like isoform X1 [Haliotis rufescens]